MFKSMMAAAALFAAPIAQAAPDEIEAKVLYSNTGTDTGIGTISQRSAGNTAAAADDFTVPEGEVWSIGQVDVTGAYVNGSGPAQSVMVTIFRARDKGNVGHLVGSYLGRRVTDHNGSFSIPVPKIRLRAGHYFISVVADMNFVEGEWHWQNMHEVHGLKPQWQSPGGGGSCERWKVERKCFGPGTGDHFFVLWGSRD